MKEEIYNEQELKALEDEIRAYGIPYSENDPDDRYFANFRVRLMERIDAKETKQNIVTAAWTWLTSSPLRGLSIGAGVAGIIIAVLLINPTSQVQIATVQSVQPTIEAPTAIAPKEMPKDVAIVIPHNVQPKTLKATNLAHSEKPNGAIDAANRASNFAAMDENLTGGESDGPVNLENLSEDELESVIDIVQNMQ